MAAGLERRTLGGVRTELGVPTTPGLWGRLQPTLHILCSEEPAPAMLGHGATASDRSRWPAGPGVHRPLRSTLYPRPLRSCAFGSHFRGQTTPYSLRRGPSGEGRGQGGEAEGCPP